MPKPSAQRPVAILAPMYAPAIGGVERHVERLAEGLVARGIPVDVIVTDPTGTLPANEVRNGVTVRRFPTVLGDSTYYVSPRLLRWLWGNAGRYALLHAHNYHGVLPLMARLAGRHAGVPLVVTPHYHGTGHTRFRALLHVPYRPFGSWALRGANRVTANSAAEAGWIERDFGITATVIPNGVDLAPLATAAGVGTAGDSRTAGDSGTAGETGMAPGVGTAGDSGTAGETGTAPGVAGEVRILSVGRLAPYKQVGHVVAALPHLPASHVLTIVGGGPDAAAIGAQAQRLGVSDRVRFLGHVSAQDLAQSYATADAFVTLSLEESFGLTVLEAGAAGAPVLASDIPAHREVTGYAAPQRIVLIDPQADGAAVAEALQRVIALGRSTDRTGWNLPTWDGLTDAMIGVYESVLGRSLRA